MNKENRSFPTLTIAVLCLSNKETLKKQLDWIDELYESLPDDYKEYFYCFVSANITNGISIETLTESRKEKLLQYIPPKILEEILSEFAHTRKWFSYYIQPEYAMYDLNVLTCYEKSQTDYIWLMAVDDYICSANNIVEIMELLRQYNPSGVTFRITPERKISPIDGKNIKILYKPLDVLKAIEGGGKVSCNVIKKNARINRNNKDVASFIGIAYMHLSLQALCFELSKEKKFMRIDQQIVWSAQKWGSQNNHHPEIAFNSRDSVATVYFRKHCQDYFEILSDKRIMKLKFLIYHALNFVLKSWEKETLHDLIYRTVRECIKSPFSLKVIFYFLAALVSLCLHPQYLKFAFLKPSESANPKHHL